MDFNTNSIEKLGIYSKVQIKLPLKETRTQTWIFEEFQL